MTLEQFFKSNYLSMCRYCVRHGFIAEDIEEAVSDVILKHFQEYSDALGATLAGDELQAAVRRRMTRRAMLNVRSRYTAYTWPRYAEFKAEHEAGMLTFDDPMEIAALKQMIPSTIPHILIEYEQFKGKESVRGENSGKDRVNFCRARKKFLAALTY